MCLVDGVEVEVDEHVVGVVDRPLDTVGLDTGLGAGVREALEGGESTIEVGDGVFDVQCGHGALLCGRFWCDHHARYTLG